MIFPQNIKYVLDRLTENGYTAYIVGGCVRDTLMGLTPYDYDVTTSALPAQIIECFSDRHLILSGLKHGTVAVIFSGEPVEITTYRIDGEYKDNRHPESVIFTDDIEKDLSRRDFTVNSIAMDKNGNICDPFLGRSDIAAHIIRCVGTPDKRFSEDGLRVLRALRFSSRLNFDIEPKTASAIHKNKFLLHNISSERIQAEIFKLLCGIKATDVLTQYKDVFSELMDICDNEYLNRIQLLPCDSILRLAGLFIGTSDYRKSLSFLKVSKSIYSEVVFLLENFDKLQRLSRAELKHMLGICGQSALKRLISFSEFGTGADMHGLECIIDEIIIKKEPCSLKDLDINGQDLIKIGFSGRHIGECMEYLLNEVLQNKTENNKQSLLDLSHNYALQIGLQTLK